MVDHERWQLAGSAPELCQRYLVPAITSLCGHYLAPHSTRGVMTACGSNTDDLRGAQSRQLVLEAWQSNGRPQQAEYRRGRDEHYAGKPVGTVPASER